MACIHSVSHTQPFATLQLHTGYVCDGVTKRQCNGSVCRYAGRIPTIDAAQTRSYTLHNVYRNLRARIRITDLKEFSILCSDLLW